jgi:enoyl-CoA hydratase
MTTATAELIKSEVRGAVGLITLNRPDVLNALNHALMDQLGAVLDKWQDDDAVRVLVICGSDRAFAAGADIKEMDAKSAAEMTADPHLSRWDLVGRFPKPTIAAVSGFALGGGCELALACDMIVASETAQFGQPEILIGVIPGAGGTVRLAKALGKAKAMELCLTGRRFTAREALELGLVNIVVPVESCLSEALKLAEKIAAMPPLAARAAKFSILEALDLNVGDALATERGLFYELFDTEDQKEGMKAFVEKRKANFTGK